MSLQGPSYPVCSLDWLIRKDTDAGKDWRQAEKGTTENEMVGWHHRLNGHEFEQALGVGDGQGSLACCSLWGCTQTWLSGWTELIQSVGSVMEMQSVLITHQFCICKFLYSLKRICNPKISTLGLSLSFRDTYRAVKMLHFLVCMFSATVWDRALRLLASTPHCQQLFFLWSI